MAIKIISKEQYQKKYQPVPQYIDTTAFDNACSQFKTICNEIKNYFQFEQFKGGFDQMTEVYASQKYNTTEGLGLVTAWSGANEYCIYQGKKLGYGQPQWWYKCWNIDYQPTEEEE